ncbi:hypothetical protein B0J15DRAFT_516037 [Fusarium solani]|uniref:Intradiol ring-cleavage dioxygenases domain-containing protein n=1 Tax=Fusarium solani TaxID=169388 RepID=A0A9P9GKB3_FUSSL|nr:uncharacterized protein B0J15DRAFT_516037 [Fusarium solani]KAH7240516.1 hypothetical protein B0J15DRAFT_516037 [Fusarium solani]
MIHNSLLDPYINIFNAILVALSLGTSLAKSKYGNKGHLLYEPLHCTTIQNDTCVLALDTAPTSSPGTGNATGSYSSLTGIDPDTSELLDGWNKREHGTTDNEACLRGIQVTDENGAVEFLTKVPGYYITRTTHIHITAQPNISAGTSYSASSRRFNHVYKYSPYNEPLVTLNRATNIEDSLYSDASSDGYSAVISVSQVAKDVEDGLVGYITIGVNASADALAITGGGVNPRGYLPTVSIDPSKYAEANQVDKAE